MRNMSFALTTTQVLEQTKDVTRRLGWLHLKASDLIQPVKKCMGLKPGEKIVKLVPPVRVVSVRREPLSMMTSNFAYGHGECIREGFPEMTPEQFVSMFCATHKGCTPDTVITRIEFAYEVYQ
ncbi:MAG: hypothetical protein WAW73_20125 [Rhodoferax sp.]